MGEAKGLDGLRVISGVHAADKNLPVPRITGFKRTLEGINDIDISRRDALKAASYTGLGSIFAATGLSRFARHALRKGFHSGTPGLAPSPENAAITTVPENLDVQLMGPQTLIESQGQADFSEIEKHGYSFRKRDKNGEFQHSDTPEIRLVKYRFLSGLNGNFAVDEKSLKAINAVRYRRGSPSTKSDEILVQETEVDNNENWTAIPIGGENPGDGDVWWVRVGGEDINGKPVIYEINPHNKRIPKVENETPYLLYNNFVNDSPSTNTE